MGLPSHDRPDAPSRLRDALRAAVAEGRHADCVALCAGAFEKPRANLELLVLAAGSILALAGGEIGYDAAVRRVPGTDWLDDAQVEKAAALLAARSEDWAGFEAHAWRSVRLRSDLGLYEALARRRHPGPGYHHWLAHLHRVLAPAVYLEIGVMHGWSMSHAAPRTRAIGVDPHPQLKTARRDHWRLYETTSDAFFASGALARETADAPLGLVFLDGLHTFEQTLRDFANAERFARPGTVVCIHDCLPLDAGTATRRQQTGFWSGDVWKIVPILRRWRPDLALVVVPTAPTGLALVTGLDPSSRALDAAYDEAVAAHMDLDFDPAMAAGWPVIANASAALDAFLDSRP